MSKKTKTKTKGKNQQQSLVPQLVIDCIEVLEERGISLFFINFFTSFQIYFYIYFLEGFY